MAEFDPTTDAHRRYNPLTNEYILVSPHRTKRPWNGQEEPPQLTNLPQFDPGCYLCPGNVRASGIRTEDYQETFVFENDFAAVLPPPIPHPPVAPHPLLSTEPVGGSCDVLVFNRRHNLTLSRLSSDNIQHILDEWITIYKKRGSQDDVKYVQIFENKGSSMGCSNPHPHGQVWSMSTIPTIPATELASLKRYADTEVSQTDAPKGPKGNPCILCEYGHVEATTTTDRIVVKNDHWLAVVPWWAVWPYEILLIPYKRHIPAITQLTADEKYAFSDILSKITKRYDNLFHCSFPYSMGIHQRPLPEKEENALPYDDDEANVAHLHLHFTPPLLRSATVKKFLVGFELMAEAQRDLTPEQAAAKLKACSEIHYLDDLN